MDFGEAIAIVDKRFYIEGTTIYDANKGYGGIVVKDYPTKLKAERELRCIKFNEVINLILPGGKRLVPVELDAKMRRLSLAGQVHQHLVKEYHAAVAHSDRIKELDKKVLDWAGKVDRVV